MNKMLLCACLVIYSQAIGMEREIVLHNAKKENKTMEATIWWPHLPAASYNVSFCDKIACDESEKEYSGDVKLPRSITNSNDGIPLTIHIKDGVEQPVQIWNAQSSTQQNIHRFAKLYMQHCKNSPITQDYVHIVLHCKHQCTIRDREKIAVKLKKSDFDPFCTWVNQYPNPIPPKPFYQKSFFKNLLRKAFYGTAIITIIVALSKHFEDSIRAYCSNNS